MGSSALRLLWVKTSTNASIMPGFFSSPKRDLDKARAMLRLRIKRSINPERMSAI